MPRLLLRLARGATVFAALWAILGAGCSKPAAPPSIVGTWELRPAIARWEDHEASDASFLAARSSHPDWSAARTTFNADGTGREENVYFDHTESEPIFFWELVNATSSRISITTRYSLRAPRQWVDYVVDSPDALTIDSGKMRRLRLVRVP